MPELPEVETVARQLRPLLRGRTLLEVELLDPRLDRDAAVPRGRVARDVSRIGKQIAIAFGPARRRPGRPLRLLCHLRMTGRLVWRPGRGDDRDVPHLRARLRFSGGRLLFVDPRRFGTLRLERTAASAAATGLEPLSPELTPTRLRELLAGSRQPLKPWLLRQDRLVGIGNIYACEILFAARIDPRRPAGSLTAGQTARLRTAVRRVLRRACAHRGTTFADFGDAHGRAGDFARLLCVYGAEGEPCPRCGARVARIVQAGRGTWFCRRCQPRRRMAR